MAKMNFPANPSLNDIVQLGEQQWKWDGTKWRKLIQSGVVVNAINGQTGEVTLHKSDIGLDNVENFPVATEVEAQTGTHNGRYMTPLRTKEAILELSPPTDLTAVDAHIADTTRHFTQAQISITESQISDLGTYITDYTVTESDVTAHEAALSITESQISDLGSYEPANANIQSHISSTSNPHSVTAAQVGAEPAFVKNTGFNKDFGSTAGTVTQGNDARLSNARTPLSHTHGNITNEGAIGTASDQVVVTTTSGVLTTASRSGIDLRSTFPPDSHTHTFASISSKPTTLSGYGITDAYASNNPSGYQTAAQVATAISGLVDSAPTTLDTLNELAAALGDDPNFATTVSNSIGTKVAKAGDTMTGTLVVGQIDAGNPGAGTDNIRVSGFGILGNRGAFYVTNQNTSGNIQFGIGGVHSAATKMTISNNGVVDIGGNTVFHDGYHPNADTLTTARTINGVSFNGSANITITAAPNAHNHDASNITSGTLGVARGGTGATTFTSGNVLIGAGTGAVTTLSRSGIDSRSTFPPATHTHTYADLTGTVPTWNQSTTGNAATATALTGGSKQIIKNAHASGADDFHLELFSNNVGAANEVALRLHQGDQYYGSMRLRSDGFHFTQGNSNTYRNIFFGTATGALSGNATTATTLQTARTIGGVSFNGSANINLPGVNAAGNQSTTGNAATATTFSTGRTNYKTITDGAVAGQLMWKEYGNNHTIFDASDSTSPSGGSVNNTNSQVPWSGTYPTLMGWNGTNTYGVRVDSARVSDSSGSTTGNAATATTLQTARTINGVSFNGSANITITAAPNAHTHDDRYYTESESDTRFINASGDLMSGDLDFHGATKWDVSAADQAHQRADARDDATNFSRLHWYGVSDAQNTSNFRHAWYDGSAYINVTAASGAVAFTGQLTATQFNGPLNGNAATATTASNSNQLQGYGSDTGASANTIVRRDASAYIRASYYNSSRGNETSAAASYIYDSGDGWMRKKTLANAQTEIVTKDVIENTLGLHSRNSSAPFNPTNTTQNYIGYVNSVSLFGQTDGGLYNSAFSSVWQHQIFGDFRTGQIAIRGKNNGTFTSWRTVWDTSNLTNLNQLTNGPGYVTSSGVTSVTSGDSFILMGGSSTAPTVNISSTTGSYLVPQMVNLATTRVTTTSFSSRGSATLTGNRTYKITVFADYTVTYAGTSFIPSFGLLFSSTSSVTIMGVVHRTTTPTSFTNVIAPIYVAGTLSSQPLGSTITTAFHNATTSNTYPIAFEVTVGVGPVTPTIYLAGRISAAGGGGGYQFLTGSRMVIERVA